MKKLFLALCMSGLALNVYAAKPEWAGQGADKHQAKKEAKQAAKNYKNKDKDTEEEQSIVSDTKSILDDLFSDKEKETIKDYYNENAKSGTGKYKGKMKELPKGLQKKLERGGELPPGWQKKVARGEVLDKDLRDNAEYLPDDLLSRLPKGDAAIEIIKLKDKVIKVGKGEGTVVDIIDIADILTGGSAK
ncbi:hypothetical protein ACMXYX_04500 [Neptuniibacter sp. QD72_48]|uniref:hypothetical protein n=1 Tax=unclassified Neptuniibacter TaxID=2630693 RepID=UPI0039F5DF5A